MIDELGNRMKEFYENRTKQFLPRRTHTIIRIDGKAFHTYTKGLKRPFDEGLIGDMNETAKFLCKEIQGARLGYVQSDEISILLTDFDKLTTSAWFDGNVQKITSVSSSLATAKFNELRLIRFFQTFHIPEDQPVDHLDVWCEKRKAFFDSRVFTIPSLTEVENYFIWRQQDATRNSIQSVAQSLYSHKELNNKSTNQLQEMIFQKGVNWNDYDDGLKRGRLIVKEDYLKEDSIRSRWVVENPPIFSKDKTFLLERAKLID